MVAVTPLITVVIIPPVVEREDELITEVVAVRPLIVDVKALTADVRALLFTKLAVVVAVLPLITDVRIKELVEVDIESVFEVELATRLVRSVVVAMPLMVVVRVVPEVARLLLVITDVVAVRPLMVVERMFPVTDCVKELMIEANVPDTPLTIVWKRFKEDDAVLLVMILVVPVDPPRLEVRVLVAEVRELEVRMLGAVRFVTVALVVVELPMMTFARLARVATKDETKEEAEVAFVDTRLLDDRLVE